MIKELDLSGCSRISDRGFSYLSSMSSIKKLYLSGCGFNFKNNAKNNVNNFKIPLVVPYVMVFTSMRLLKKLDLSNNSKLNDGIVKSISEQCTLITFLSLSNCKNISPTCFFFIGDKLKFLESKIFIFFIFF